MRFCEDSIPVLHSDSDRVSPDILEKSPPSDWKSLQLVHRENVEFYCQKNYCGMDEWRARFQDHYGRDLKKALKVTDCAFVKKMEGSREPEIKNCLLTISLGRPWAPKDHSMAEFCYKLVAGVIEL